MASNDAPAVNGVSNYAYDQYGNYSSTNTSGYTARVSSISSTQAQAQQYRELPTTSSVWNSARRQETRSYLSHGTTGTRASTDELPPIRDGVQESSSAPSSRTVRLVSVDAVQDSQDTESAVKAAAVSDGVIYVR